MLVSTDVRRPAAIEQLSVLAEQIGVRVHDPAGEMDPVVRAAGALAATQNLGFDTLIVDTAGRLHIDDELMGELEAIKAAVEPTDLLYVADAMTGQDAVKSAGEFNHRIGVDRRRADEDGRRRARRRGAVGRRRRRRADRVRRHRRARCRTSRRSRRTGSCRACSAWATCCRSSSAPKRRSTTRAARGSSRRRGSTTSRSRIFAISCARSRRWGRSSRCWA